MSRPITERMAEAKAKMQTAGDRGLPSWRYGRPRVFFLNPTDFDEFAATKPGTVEELFAFPLGCKPSPMTCLGFDGTAVRATTAKPDKQGRIHSKLYCDRGRCLSLQRE